MRHVNKVELLGRVYEEPNITTTRNGNRRCVLKLVTNENRKDKESGEWITDAEFHNVVIWKDDAITDISDGVRKGCTVSITGKKKTRKWQGHDGKDNYTVEIVVDRFGEFQFLEAAKEYVDKSENASPRKAAPRQAPKPAPEIFDKDDEIPF